MTTSLIDQAAASGEALIPLRKIKLLRSISTGTLHRWVRSGKVPAVQIGRMWYSTPELARAALNQTATPPTLEIPEQHTQAVAALENRGIKTRKGR